MKLNAQFQFNQSNDPQEWCAAVLFRLQQSHQEERFHAIPICNWEVAADPNVSCRSDGRRPSQTARTVRLFSRMDHVERNRYVRPQTVLSLSWTPMTLCAELLLAEYDHLADFSFLDSLCIIGGILARRLCPRGCRCHKDGEDIVSCWHARATPGCI